MRFEAPGPSPRSRTPGSRLFGRFEQDWFISNPRIHAHARAHTHTHTHMHIEYLILRWRQVYAVFLFLAAASLFGTIVSQVMRGIRPPHGLYPHDDNPRVSASSRPGENPTRGPAGTPPPATSPVTSRPPHRGVRSPGAAAQCPASGAADQRHRERPDGEGPGARRDPRDLPLARAQASPPG